MAQKKKILVVDDEPYIVRVVQANLMVEGYEVVAAYDGLEALQRLQEEKPDLVLLDVMMPEMDGWAVLERIRSNPETENLPVIMLTALAQDTDIERGTLLGCDVYITKPFEPRDLVNAVRRMLEGMEEERLLRGEG